jgi:hypothetical protein
MLLDWLLLRAPAVYSHFALAQAIGVSSLRVGQVLGNVVHVQHFHGIAALVRLGDGVEHGRRVSMWSWNG